MWRIRIHATYKPDMERICHTCVRNLWRNRAYSSHVWQIRNGKKYGSTRLSRDFQMYWIEIQALDLVLHLKNNVSFISWCTLASRRRYYTAEYKRCSIRDVIRTNIKINALLCSFFPILLLWKNIIFPTYLCIKYYFFLSVQFYRQLYITA